jgi:hypothetical protein
MYVADMHFEDWKMNIKFFLVVDRDNNNNLTVLYCILVETKT